MIRRALLPLLLAATPCCAEEPSYSLTTDTPAYCQQLNRRVADHHSVNPDVQRLAREGREMCEQGQVRGGIRRLRHALVLLRHRPPAP